MNTHRQIVACIAIIFMVCAAANSILIPLMHRVQRNETTIAQLSNKAKGAKDIKSKQTWNTELRQQLTIKNQLLGKRLPLQMRSAEIIIWLSEQAEKRSLNQTSIQEIREISDKDLGEKSRSPINYCLFIWQGKGSFTDFKSFLSEIERSERLFQVSKLAVSRQDVDSEVPSFEPQFDFTLHVLAFSQ